MHRFGIALSFLCAIHCLTFPILLALIPSFATYIHLNIWLEILLILLLIGSGLLVFVKDYKAHKNIKPSIFFILGILIIISFHLFPIDKMQIIPNLVGGLLLIYGHFSNWRLHRNHCSHKH